MAANYGWATGLAEGTKNWPGLMVSGMGLKANLEHQQAIEQIARDRLKIAQDEADRNRQAFEHAEKKRVEQETIENAVVPASQVNPKFHAFPRVVPQYVEIMKNAGFKITETPDEVYGSNKAFAYLREVMKTKHEAIVQASQSALDDLQDQSNTLGQQILQVQQSGKEDEKTAGQLQKLQKQQLDIKTQIGVVIGGREKVMEQIAIAQAKSVQPDTVPYMTKEGKTVLINERDPKSQAIIDQQVLIPVSVYKEKEIDKLTVWPTAAEAIKAGKSTGSIPEGKTVVAKPAKGGFIYDYESPFKEAKQTEAERDPDAYKFSHALDDAKKTEQTPLFMEKLSETEQQRAEARLRSKTKSNYLARGGNPKKFDKFFAEGVYGAPTLDKNDIVKLKEFATPDEAISHTERAFRANMISPEVKDQAISLINQNRKKWDAWRKTL
ncbi:MAG: hypothetical protein MUO85_03525 [candidate division Zixibacteria bacterium]|nr:hypothetical protein [candidate division Zixibacteria bacterium]